MEMNVEKTKVMSTPMQLSTLQVMINQKQLENVEYFKYLGSIITNDARCTNEIKSRIAMANAPFKKNKKKKQTLLTRKLGLNLKKKLVTCSMWSTALYGAETWKLWKVEQKYLECGAGEERRSVGPII
jgi:hypothetical protein